MLERFFRMPEDAKQNYIVPGSKGSRGYTGMMVERLLLLLLFQT